VVAKYGGLSVTHIRDEGDQLITAINEAIEIIEKSGCAGHISHLKASGKMNWGKSGDALSLIQETNIRGVNVTCDQYPYSRGMTLLITVLPPWSHIGGVEKVLERLQNPNDQEKIRKDTMTGLPSWQQNFIKDGGWESIYIASVKTEEWKDVVGKNLAEITQLKGYSDEFMALFDLIIDEKAEVTITLEMMSEKDIREIMQGRYTMFGTDGWGVSPTGIMGHGKPHPRFYGAFPRILGKYVREEGIMRLEEAIRKMTSFPAQRLGLWDRGLLREGFWADVVIFDPLSIIDNATYENPHQFSTGIHYVLVNGELVVEHNQQAEVLPGKILRWQT
jgi:N-acyl-D-amino-acid deacylase